MIGGVEDGIVKWGGLFHVVSWGVCGGKRVNAVCC